MTGGMSEQRPQAKHRAARNAPVAAAGSTMWNGPMIAAGAAFDSRFNTERRHAFRGRKGAAGSRVNSQPPHCAMQCAFPASIMARPAAASLGLRRASFSTDAISALSASPCVQGGGVSGSMNLAKSKPSNMAQSPAKGPYAAATASSQQISSQAAAFTFASSLCGRMRTTVADFALVSAKFRRNRMLARTTLGSTRSLNPPLPSSFPDSSNIPAPITDQGLGSGTVCPFPHSHMNATPNVVPRRAKFIPAGNTAGRNPGDHHDASRSGETFVTFAAAIRPADEQRRARFLHRRSVPCRLMSGVSRRRADRGPGRDPNPAPGATFFATAADRARRFRITPENEISHVARKRLRPL